MDMYTNVILITLIVLFIPGMWLGDRLSDLIHVAKMWARSEDDESRTADGDLWRDDATAGYVDRWGDKI